MSRTIVVMSMGGVGHVQVLLPVIAELRARGTTVYLMTHADFQTEAAAAGAEFIDLYDGHPMSAADAASKPIPSRNVTFAGVYAESVARRVAPLGPGLIIYDTFTVVAPVVARLLSIPYVNVCPNHALVASRALAELQTDPRVATSEACWNAVRRLREVHRMPDASPFSYVAGVSPYLNLYCEPAEFLAEADRASFAPLAFFGSLPPSTQSPTPNRRVPSAECRVPRFYLSFGTVIWWYFETAALAALTAITGALADENVEVLVSLGRHQLAPAGRAAVQRANAQVVDYVDQGSVLADSDVFVTHHGINSTHEAIFHQVPMLSYPFFGDQPALARRCQDLGLAIPLTSGPMEPVDPAKLRNAIARLKAEREQFSARLADARGWELRTMADRGPVVDRILSLVGAAPS